MHCHRLKASNKVAVTKVPNKNIITKSSQQCHRHKSSQQFSSNTCHRAFVNKTTTTLYRSLQAQTISSLSGLHCIFEVSLLGDIKNENCWVIELNSAVFGFDEDFWPDLGTDIQSKVDRRNCPKQVFILFWKKNRVVASVVTNQEKAPNALVLKSSNHDPNLRLRKFDYKILATLFSKILRYNPKSLTLSIYGELL